MKWNNKTYTIRKKANRGGEGEKAGETNRKKTNKKEKEQME